MKNVWNTVRYEIHGMNGQFIQKMVRKLRSTITRGSLENRSRVARCWHRIVVPIDYISWFRLTTLQATSSDHRRQLTALIQVMQTSCRFYTVDSRRNSFDCKSFT